MRLSRCTFQRCILLVKGLKSEGKGLLPPEFVFSRRGSPSAQGFPATHQKAGMDTRFDGCSALGTLDQGTDMRPGGGPQVQL